MEGQKKERPQQTLPHLVVPGPPFSPRWKPTHRYFCHHAGLLGPSGRPFETSFFWPTVMVPAHWGRHQNSTALPGKQENSSRETKSPPLRKRRKRGVKGATVRLFRDQIRGGRLRTPSQNNNNLPLSWREATARKNPPQRGARGGARRPTRTHSIATR